MSDKTDELVKVFMDVLPRTREQVLNDPLGSEFDSEYTISVRRKDGRGMSEEEAEAVISAYFMQAKFKRFEEVY